MPCSLPAGGEPSSQVTVSTPSEPLSRLTPSLSWPPNAPGKPCGIPSPPTRCRSARTPPPADKGHGWLVALRSAPATLASPLARVSRPVSPRRRRGRGRRLRRRAASGCHRAAADASGRRRSGGCGAAILRGVDRVDVERHAWIRPRPATRARRRPGRRVRRNQVDDRAAGAVADVEPGMVAAADDAVADVELTLAGAECPVAEPAAAEHQRACCLVEVAHVVAPVGQHRDVRDSLFGCAPPVLEQPLLAASASWSRWSRRWRVAWGA